MNWSGRFTSGDVELCIYGRNAERFFQLCVTNGICIRHLVRTGPEEYRCHMTRRGVWDSRPYYHKTGMHCRILRKWGLPFLLFRYRRRILFPLALCAVWYLMGYCSQFIWRIEIHGNSYLTKEQLVAYLEEKDASYGTRKSAIDCDEIELMLRENFDEIIWASVALEGTNLVIELQEKTGGGTDVAYTDDIEETINNADTDEITGGEADSEENAGGNLIYPSEGTSVSYVIIADKDATITSIVTRRGLATVIAGDEVSEGDVLVEGMQEVLDDNGETKFWYASIPDADIIGTVIYEYTDSVSATVTVKSYGDAVLSGLYLQLPMGRLEIDLPFGMDENTEILESYYQAHLTEQFYLPFGLGIRHSILVEEETAERTDEEALIQAEANLEKYLTGLEEDGVVILSKTVTMHKKGDEYVVEGEIEAEEAVGAIVAAE